MRLQNRWGGRPALDVRLQLRRLSLPALGSLAAAWPTPIASGEASGALRLNRDGEQWRCQGRCSSGSCESMTSVVRNCAGDVVEPACS